MTKKTLVQHDTLTGQLGLRTGGGPMVVGGAFKEVPHFDLYQNSIQKLNQKTWAQ